MATVRPFQVNNGLEVNATANVGTTLTAQDFYANTGTPTYGSTVSIDFRYAKTLDSRISFSRASSGYYQSANGQYVFAANNVPRIDFAGGKCNGLLIEEPRTNWYPYGDIPWRCDVDSITLNLMNVVAVPNSSPANTTSYQITSKVKSGENSLYLFEWYGLVSLGAGERFTASVFIKPLASSVSAFSTVGFRLWTGAGRAWTTNRYAIFNLYTGAKNYSSGTLDDWQIQAFPNGWYRISISATADQAGSSAMSLFFDGVYDSTTSWLMWGLQGEKGMYPTSYIPTNGAQVTRAADVVNIPTTNATWFNQTQGTLYGEYTILTGGLNADGYPQYLSLVGDDPANMIVGNYFAFASVNKQGAMIDYNANVAANGTTLAVFQNVDITTNALYVAGVVGNTYKAAISYGTNTNTMSVNGYGASQVASNTNARATIKFLNLSQQGRYQYQPSCYFKKLVYYPTSMSNTQTNYITL